MAQMEERERIARELHDTLLQGFQGITLRVQGVVKNMPAQDPLRKMMDDVLDRADGVSTRSTSTRSQPSPTDNG